MSKTGFLRSATAATLAAAVFATSSMVALAAPGKALMGELTVAGNRAVTINGETANTGRTIFSSNTIATPADSGAVVNLGALGQVELAPNSSMNLVFDENGISGTLLNGQVKVSGAPDVAANITTGTGSVTAETSQAKSFVVNFNGTKTEAASELGSVILNESGKSVKIGNKQDNDDDQGFLSGQSLVYAILFGVAAGALIYVATDDSNETNASSGVIVSPTR